MRFEGAAVILAIDRRLPCSVPRPVQAVSGLLLLLACINSAFAATLYASPTGAATGPCSATAPCSLEAAQSRVRVWRHDGRTAIDVAVRDGIYRLRQPLQFLAADSGTLGYPVSWHAAPGANPVFAGSRSARAQPEGRLWSVAIRPSDGLSSIYLNGQRRLPARTASCAACKVDKQGLYDIPAQVMHSLQVGSTAVLHARWRDFRCRVTALDRGRVTLAQPCWRNASLNSRPNDWKVASPFGKYYGGVDWFEDLAGEPATPGSFTVDARRGVLRYRPRAGESPQPAAIEIPALAQLLRVDGTLAEPVHELTFSGITFAYVGWRKPLSDDGYVSLQAGYLVDGADRSALPDNGEGMTRIGVAVQVAGGRNIVFDHDTFAHLAAAGISLAGGTHGSAVVDSRFFDDGGGAIFAGDTVAHPAQVDDKSSDIRIEDNRIDHVALAYRDNVGIMAGFVNGLSITHNTISDLPYSGISVGWGWNYEGKDPVESSIHIVANRIDRVMLQLVDGGAVYTQGESTPGTSCVVRNFVNMHRSGTGNGIYLDEHSVNFEVEHNVVLGSWVSAWAPWSGDLRIISNWTDTAGGPHLPGPTKVWSPNFTMLKVLPAQAQEVRRAAGAQAGTLVRIALPVRINILCPVQENHRLSSGMARTHVTALTDANPSILAWRRHWADRHGYLTYLPRNHRAEL